MHSPPPGDRIRVLHRRADLGGAEEGLEGIQNRQGGERPGCHAKIRGKGAHPAKAAGVASLEVPERGTRLGLVSRASGHRFPLQSEMLVPEYGCVIQLDYKR